VKTLWVTRKGWFVIVGKGWFEVIADDWHHKIQFSSSKAEMRRLGWKCLGEF